MLLLCSGVMLCKKYIEWLIVLFRSNVFPSSLLESSEISDNFSKSLIAVFSSHCFTVFYSYGRLNSTYQSTRWWFKSFFLTPFFIASDLRVFFTCLWTPGNSGACVCVLALSGILWGALVLSKFGNLQILWIFPPHVLL